MGNIKTCVDTSREKSLDDDMILEERFRLLDNARSRLYDPETGSFRTMAEAMEIAKTEKR